MNNNIYKSISLWAIKIGLFLVPFIPLYVSRSLFFPYITGKAFIFRTIIEIVFAAWIFLAIFYEEYRPRKSPLLWAILIWILVISAATLFAVNPLRALWSNFERMEGLITYLHLTAYFLVLTHVFRKNDWLILFNIFLISGLFENVYALLQKLGYYASPQGGFRVDGTIGNPTYLAAYLTFILAFSLYLLLESKNYAIKWIYGASSFFTLLIIYFTATRGAILALLGGFIVAALGYIMFAPNKSPSINLYKKIIAAVLCIFIVVISAIWLLRATSFVTESPILSRLTSLSFTERTITSRFTIWSMSWEGVKERPILGWGPENYNIVFSRYFNPELWRQEPWFDRSHNIVFDWLVNGGIIGFIAFFGMLAAALYSLLRCYKKNIVTFEMGLLLTVMLFAYIFQNLFVFDNIATYIGLFVVLAFIDNLLKSDNDAAKNSLSLVMYQPFVLLIMMALASIAVFFVNIQPLRANLNLLGVLKVQGSNPQQAYDYYDKIFANGYLGRTEAREQFVQYAMSVGGSNLDAAFKDKVLRRAQQEAEANTMEHPLDPRSYLFLGALYSRLTAADSATQGQLMDKALEVFNSALKLSPKKQQIYFELADVYLKKGDYVNAVRVAKEAYDLDPSFTSARMNLAATLMLDHKQEEADAILAQGYGTVSVPDNILVQVYSRLTDQYRAEGNNERALFYSNRLTDVWRAFIQKDPDNLEHRKRLVLVYLVMGQQQEAQEVLNEALSYKPEFRSEVEEFIKQLQQQ